MIFRHAFRLASVDCRKSSFIIIIIVIVFGHLSKPQNIVYIATSIAPSQRIILYFKWDFTFCIISDGCRVHGMDNFVYHEIAKKTFYTQRIVLGSCGGAARSLSFRISVLANPNNRARCALKLNACARQSVSQCSFNTIVQNEIARGMVKRQRKVGKSIFVWCCCYCCCRSLCCFVSRLSHTHTQSVCLWH